MPRFAFPMLLGLLLVLAAGFQPAAAAEKSALTPAQREEVKKLVREYLLENPEVIPEVINILQAKEQKAKVEDDKVKAVKRAEVAKTRKAEMVNPPEGTVVANPKGDVTLVEFFDYNCGYCKRVFTVLMEATKSDPKLRLVVKEWPILGAASVSAARAALAARKQGKYAELHAGLLTYKGQLDADTIMQIAKSAGLDTKKLQDDMKSAEITAILDKNHDLAEALGIDGTPAMFIGDNFVPGAVEKDDLIKLVADARKK